MKFSKTLQPATSIERNAESRRPAMRWLWDSRFSFFVYYLLYVGTVPQPVPAQSATHLYFYPPAYRFQDGRALDSPQTVSTAQITTEFPEIHEMNGVVLMIYWSTLCPHKGTCDFKIIDETISYWAQRGKKIVLDVATIGFPIRKLSNGVETIQNATPDWVLAKVRNYKFKTRVLGVNSAQRIDGVFPDFRDSAFVSEVDKLTRMLGIYDGNVAISQIRIATGMMGEDNPMVGSLSAPLAGYKEQMWLDYCRAITNNFIRVFHQSELEFDIGRLSWMYAVGGPTDKGLVDEFVNYLANHRIMLAFDGLGSQFRKLNDDGQFEKNGIARSAYYLKLFKRQGLRVGLEAIGPMASAQMQDADEILMAIKDINTDRLVFFQDMAALVNYDRYGKNKANQPMIQVLTDEQRIKILSNSIQILKDLGFN